MDLYDLARNGETDMLAVLLMDQGEVANITELAIASIEGNHIDTLQFLIDNGADDIDYLYDIALSLGRSKIVEYLEATMEGEEQSGPLGLEDAVADDDIDTIKDLLRKGDVTINDVGEMASRYNNRHILRYALKFGADAYDRMISATDDPDLIEYLEDMKDMDEWMDFKRRLGQ